MIHSHCPLPKIETYKASCTPHSSSISSLCPNFLHSQPFGKRPFSSSQSWTVRAQYWILWALCLHSFNTYEQMRFSLQNKLLLIESLHPYSVLLSSISKKRLNFIFWKIIVELLSVLFIPSKASLHIALFFLRPSVFFYLFFRDELCYKPVLKKILS